MTKKKPTVLRAREVRTGDVVERPATQRPAPVMRRSNPDTHTVRLLLSTGSELLMPPDALVRVTRVTKELNHDDPTPTVEFSSASTGY